MSFLVLLKLKTRGTGSSKWEGGTSAYMGFSEKVGGISALTDSAERKRERERAGYPLPHSFTRRFVKMSVSPDRHVYSHVYSLYPRCYAGCRDLIKMIVATRGGLR